MHKCALYIPRPGDTSRMVQHGYVDTLRHLGWTVYVGDPKTKLCCKQWIEEYGVQLIITHSRYGIRQLPINVINDKHITVFVNALPLNKNKTTIDDPYEFAHDDEPYLIREINSVVVHTSLETHIWPECMLGWKDGGVDLLFLPLAGNIMKSVPPTCDTLTDVVMVANFGHRQGIMKHLIEPLFKRVDLLGYSHQAFGDNVWQLAGLSHNGPLVGDVGKLAHVYATAKVCPNVHTERQISLQAYVNERSFMIPLCGGVQVSDNPLVEKYLGPHCIVSASTTDFMDQVLSIAESQYRCFEQIKAGVSHVANNHTYFNRLALLFANADLDELSKDTESSGKRVAIQHCWELDARLGAAERNVPYGKEVIGIA